MKPIAFLIFTAVIVGIITILFFGATSSASDIASSLAEIEQAKAYREAAAANHDAIRSLGALAILDRLQSLLLVLLSLAVVFLIAYILVQNRKNKSQQTALLDKPRWTPGPNAGWRKVGDAQPQPAQLPQPQVNLQDAMNMAAMGMMVSITHSLQNGNRQPQLPAGTLPMQSQQQQIIDTTTSNYFSDDQPTCSDWDLFNR